MKYLLLILLISHVCLVSCSDLKKEAIKKPELQHSSFAISCKLDMKSLGNLMTKDVSSDIDCLESYLQLVANVLKSGKPRAIGKKEFKTLLEEGIDGLLEDIDPAIIKALDAVFELNFLIGSGDRDFITTKQLSSLMKILKGFNKQVIPIYLKFSDTGKVPYQWHKNRRQENGESIELMLEPILEAFNRNRNNIDQVDIIAILNTFTSKDSLETISMIRQFLIVKKIILGGSTQKITHIELYQLFKKLPAIAGIVYDALKFSDIEFGEIINNVDFFNTALKDIGRDILVGGKVGNQKLFSIRELEIYFKKIYKKPLDIDYFEASDFVFNMKKIFFGKGREFTGNQLRVFVNFLREIGYKFQYFLKMYDAHSDLLDQPYGVQKFNFNRIVAQNPEEIELQKEFTQIFEKHLFFRRGSKPVIFKARTIKTPRSIIEYAGYEMIAEKVMKYWEREFPCDGPGFTKENGCKKENYQNDLNPEQLRTFVRLGADFLDKSGIIAKDSLDSTVDSITSLVDIFLLSSDGNLQVDKYELTEFITAVISAIDMRNVIVKRLRSTCPVDDRNEIDANCFKDEFFNEMFKTGGEIDYGNYMPLLKKYVGSMKDGKNESFMSDTLTVVRKCQTYTNGEIVPVTRGSVYSTLIVLMHIESLMIRFDKNENNTLEASEIKTAFFLFDEEIKEDLPIFKGWKSWKQKILWYLLTKRQKPGTFTAIGFWFKSKKKFETTIERSNFMSLLRTLSIDGEPEGFDSCEKPRVK